MTRSTAATALLMTVLVTAGCAGTAWDRTPGAAGPASTPTGPTTPTTTAPLPAAEPFLAAGYPTPADADTAFVSEVAGIEGVGSFLLRTPFILPADLTAASEGIARRGRGVCTAYNGDNLPTVVRDLQFSTGVDGTVDVMTLDEIDATAFAVAAVGVYCPEALVDLGEDEAMTGGVEVRQVTPACPTDSPVSVVAGEVQLTGQSNVELYGDLGEYNDDVYGDTDGMYDGSWTYTLTNSSDYPVLATVEEQVSSARYTTEWAAPRGPFGGNPQPPFVVPAHGTATGEGSISGVYAWQGASYRVTSWIPVSCQVLVPQPD